MTGGLSDVVLNMNGAAGLPRDLPSLLPHAPNAVCDVHFGIDAHRRIITHLVLQVYLIDACHHLVGEEAAALGVGVPVGEGVPLEVVS